GDVLFLADLFGGSSPRGLFLYKKATGTIVKVAAIGDPSPVGNLDALAGGSLNNNDEVAFLGGPGNSNQQMAVLHWKNGVLRLVVKPGHQIPGGTVTSLVWFGFNAPDSTYIPFAELPDINDSGAISFYAVLNGTIEGLFVSRDGVHELYVQTGQETPAGGAFFSLYAPILNNAGEIAFSGEYKLDPWTAGWFVGRPGRWRQVLSFYDRLQGGQAWGIAVSHNPQQPLDDDGNLIVWSDVMVDGGSSLHTVNVGYSDGTFETIVKGGDPSPMGGMIGELYAWPTLRSRFCGIEASLFGIPGVYGAYLESLKRPMQVTDLTLGAPDPLSESSLLSWTGQPSSSDGSLGYDVARGRLGGFGEPAACAADHLAGTSWVDPPAGCLAPPGEGCWYLVRAEDSCGRGSYGAEGTLCTDPCGGGPLGCPYCGDGRVAGTESCDGADFAGESCVTKGFDGGSLECTPNCTLNLSGCLTNCGDGMVRGSEQCDGTNLKNQWCPTLGFNRGILSCSETCTFDTSGCCCTDGRPGCAVCPVCGNNVREPPFEFCDGTFTNGETCMSQGRPPGTLLCNFRCDGYDYSGCTGYEAMNPFPLHPLSTPGTDANP
ncbi:MAG TPA: hypothetical protein VFG76_02000, partial [Candidatus Polarisedimenticolia bacterium]|nr:hypothetical protein [Candidatus Polarisedimenticolia bacterium]